MVAVWTGRPIAKLKRGVVRMTEVRISVVGGECAGRARPTPALLIGGGGSSISLGHPSATSARGSGVWIRPTKPPIPTHSQGEDMDREALPPTLSVSEFRDRFESLQPGQELRYHVGSLAIDRLFNQALDEVAEAALVLGTDVGVEVHPYTGAAFPYLPPVYGQGKGVLLQRHHDRSHSYLIVKRFS